VTGGTGILGRAVTESLRKDGFEVVVAARGHKAFEPDQEDEEISFATLDVTDPESIARTVDAEGPISVLVHLVGAFKGGAPLHETPIQVWDEMNEVNLRSAFLCARAVLPAMLRQGWGRIVLVSSRSAQRGFTGNAAYSVAKAGLATLAQAIAEECRGTDVTANVVAPSTIDTPENRGAWPTANHDCWVDPGSIATAISFLSSEAAGDLRGAWLPVYGSV
jgi:NAD(P)-dependent dehydrogenase (short-subunit alcohol dehydrogenase family)